MRCFVALLAVVLSIVQGSFIKRIRHMLAAIATGTNGPWSLPVMLAVLGNYARLGQQTDTGNRCLAPAALQPPHWRISINPPSRERPWQDLHGGMADAIDIAKAQMDIANAKIRQKDLDRALVDAHAEIKYANAVLSQVKERQNAMLCLEAPTTFDKAEEAAKKAQTNFENAKDAMLASEKETCKVKTALTAAKAEIAAAKKAQSPAGQTANQQCNATGRVDARSSDW